MGWQDTKGSTNMTVYVVYETCVGEITDLLGVFTTDVLADQFIEEQSNPYNLGVKVFTLDLGVAP